MEKEIRSLKNEMGIRQKKQVLEYLNSPVYKNSKPYLLQSSSLSFAKWFESVLMIEDSDLQKVFDSNLIEGIKAWFSNCIKLHGLENIPILAFTQKPNHFYILDENQQWKTMSNEEFHKCMNQISTSYVRTFVKWRKIHETEISGSEDAQEMDIQHMMKINGYKLSTDRRNQEIRKWLYEHLSRDLDPNATMVIEF